MAYTDFGFYREKYYGRLLNQETFPEYEEKASDWLELPTSGRIRLCQPDELSNAKIQKCVCAIAEALYKLQNAEDTAEKLLENKPNEERLVKSESSGTESRSYFTPAELSSGVKEYSSVYSSIKSESEKDKMLFGIAKRYLTGITTNEGVPLLYMGL